MKTTTILITLTILTTGLAGCTGDPDGGGNDEFDAETLQGMIEAGLEDFMNNTTVEITTNYYTNETSTTTNNVNGSGGVSASSLHTMAGTAPPAQDQFHAIDEYGLAILFREDQVNYWEGFNVQGFDGIQICVSIGSEMEGLILSWFSNNGISFTSVPIADAAEATSKLVDGSCGGMVGWWDEMINKEGQLENNGSMNGVGLSTYTLFSGSGFGGFNHLELTIQQEAGFSTTLLGIHFESSVIGVCTNLNCTAEDEDIVRNYTIHAWVGLGGTDSWYWIDSTTGAEVSSECEYDLTLDYSRDIIILQYPGLSCEHTVRAALSPTISGNLGNIGYYEFTWTDWTYVIHWESSPVTLHE